MSRYEVIESKAWKHDDGRTASLYGAVPWTSASEEPRWKVVTRGYTIRDNMSGTVGIGRQPWKTRAEAQAWADKENKRLADLAASRGRPAHATKKGAGRSKKIKISTSRPIGWTITDPARPGWSETGTTTSGEIKEALKPHRHHAKKKSPAQLDREIAAVLVPFEGMRVLVTKVGAKRHGVLPGLHGTIKRVTSPDVRRGIPTSRARVLVSVHGSEFSTDWPTDALRVG